MIGSPTAPVGGGAGEDVIATAETKKKEEKNKRT
jgi:hypothetical protein